MANTEMLERPSRQAQWQWIKTAELFKAPGTVRLAILVVEAYRVNKKDKSLKPHSKTKQKQHPLKN